MPDFDEEEYKKAVREHGANIENPYYTVRSKTKTNDLNNYRRYYQIINGDDNNLVDFKDFID